ncbi:hypothetical protein LI328DRAFT_162940 [Trichoderma asperelloides]|nr:hypothetical protein LI328DRAFT_162940 [Trichoderma asperelloides]
MGKVKPMTFEIPLKASFTIPNLLEMIWTTIKSPKNWEQIGAALLREPDKFVLLLMKVGTEIFGSDLIKRIVCRKAQPKNIKARSRSNFEKDVKDDIDKIKEVVEKVKKWVGTAVSAAAAAVTIAEFVGAFGATIGGMIMKANDEVEKASVQAMITPIEEMLKALKEKQDEIETKIRSSLMMTGLVTADHISYEVRMSTENFLPKDSKVISELEYSKKNDEYRYTDKVFVWVRAPISWKYDGVIKIVAPMPLEDLCSAALQGSEALTLRQAAATSALAQSQTSTQGPNFRPPPAQDRTDPEPLINTGLKHRQQH